MASTSIDKITDIDEGSEKSSSDSEESAVCLGCNQSKPPIKRYTKTEWTCCDTCENLWHLECACLDRKSASIISAKDFQFPCSFCVLKNLPGVTTIHEIGKSFRVFHKRLDVLRKIRKKEKIPECPRTKSSSQTKKK